MPFNPLRKNILIKTNKKKRGEKRRKKRDVAISKEKSTGAVKLQASSTPQTSGGICCVGERCEGVCEMW